MAKLSKKNMIIIIAAIVAVLIIVNILAFSIFVKKDSGSSSGILGSFTQTEEEKFAEYSAAIACEFLGLDFEQKDAFTKAIDNVQIITQDYGYTYSETMNLTEKYQQDPEFAQLAYNEMKKKCGAEMEKAGITEFTPAQQV